uniref:Uncharacterized protein n=1 Tax=Triticum urartu TaxID=4572 RepID=A0A8R7U0V6_TRIUA
MSSMPWKDSASALSGTGPTAPRILGAPPPPPPREGPAPTAPRILGSGAEEAPSPACVPAWPAALERSSPAAG